VGVVFYLRNNVHGLDKRDDVIYGKLKKQKLKMEENK